MVAALVKEYGTALSKEDASLAVRGYVNRVCAKILDCTAVFKRDAEGKAAFERFVESVGFKVKK